MAKAEKELGNAVIESSQVNLFIQSVNYILSSTKTNKYFTKYVKLN